MLGSWRRGAGRVAEEDRLQVKEGVGGPCNQHHYQQQKV
jgi:hypothetical protein